MTKMCYYIMLSQSKGHCGPEASLESRAQSVGSSNATETLPVVVEVATQKQKLYKGKQFCTISKQRFSAQWCVIAKRNFHHNSFPCISSCQRKKNSALKYLKSIWKFNILLTLVPCHLKKPAIQTNILEPWMLWAQYDRFSQAFCFNSFIVFGHEAVNLDATNALKLYKSI